jgi:thiamine biosynthesis lipoprotein
MLKNGSLPELLLMRVAQRGMGTEFEVLLPHNCGHHATDLALHALEEVRRIEHLLSIYAPHSDISRINRSAGGGFQRVHRDVATVLREAVEISKSTAGAFDVTAGPLVEAWGFTKRHGEKPSVAAIHDALGKTGFEGIEIDGEANVRLKKKGMSINLGGIGKGFAVDRAGLILRAEGIRPFLIHGGQSSAIARGSQHPDLPGWGVILDHPLRSNHPLGRIWLTDRALATSGSGRQFFHFQGQRFGHVIDPRTGWPVEGIMLSLTVLAPRASQADALATGMFVLGIEESFALAQRTPDVGLICVSSAEREGEVSIRTFGVEDVWEPNVPNAPSID